MDQKHHFQWEIIENRTFGIWNKVPKRSKTQKRSKIHVLKQKSGLRIRKTGFWLLNFRFWVSLNRKFNQILSNPGSRTHGSEKFGVDLIKIHDSKILDFDQIQKNQQIPKRIWGFSNQNREIHPWQWIFDFGRPDFGPQRSKIRSLQIFILFDCQKR